jgi:phosphate transport system substrate-binding protein
VLKWVNWDYEHGDQIATQLEYVPLPAQVKDMVRSTWRQQLAYK